MQKISDNKQNKHCALICNRYRDDERLSRAAVDVGDLVCQFGNQLVADYEYGNESFCLLHLPFIAKKEQNLFYHANEVVIRLLDEGWKNFNFVSLQGIDCHDISGKYLSFIGAYLWSMKFNSVKINGTLDISYAVMRGISYMRACDIDSIRMVGSDLSSYLEVSNKSNINILRFDNSEFHYSDRNQIRLDDANYGIKINDVTISRFVFRENCCELSLDLSNSKIKYMDMSSTHFYQCPTFSRNDFSEENDDVKLPAKKYFILTSLERQYRFYWWKNIICYTKGAIKNYRSNTQQAPRALVQKFRLIRSINPFRMTLKKRNTTHNRADAAFADQYRKFRHIYNLTKQRGMYLEESDFFYLMQRCFEKNTDNTLILRFSSKCYRWLSNYGQSITKPLVALLTVWMACSLIYLITGVNRWLLAPIMQIIKPFYLLFEPIGHHQLVIYMTCLFGTTISLISVALLLVALRWNFRKSLK